MKPADSWKRVESWQEVLNDLKERDMPSPILSVGDGALGFWKVIRQLYPKIEEKTMLSSIESQYPGQTAQKYTAEC